MSRATAPEIAARTLHVTSIRRDPFSRVISLGVGGTSTTSATSPSGTVAAVGGRDLQAREWRRGCARTSGAPQTTTSKSRWSS